MIDRGLTRPWPQELIDSLEAFVQGDIIDAPPFVFTGSRVTSLWGGATSQSADGGAGQPAASLDDDKEVEVVEVEPSEKRSLGIITTNTCDLCEVGEPEQPWFQLSPVYRIESDATTLKQYLVRLDPP